MRKLGFCFLAACFTMLSANYLQAQCPTSGNVVVTNTSSNASTANSLPWAINCINTVTPLTTIAFNIPAAGVNTILLTAALPTVTKQNARIDGTITESVIIDGSNLAGGPPVNGLVLTGSGITVRGIEIRNFTSLGTGGSAIRITGGTNDVIDGNTLHANRIGISTSVTTLGLDITNNTIGLNSAGLPSGNTGGGIVFQTALVDATVSDNTIAHNGSSGITIASGSTVLISENSMYCNIGVGISRPDGPAEPVITNATTQAISGTAAPGRIIEVFEYEDTGCPSAAACQGRRYLGTVTSTGVLLGTWTLNLAAGAVTAGNQVVATSTQTSNSNTSRFSGCQTIVGCGSFSASINTTPITCNGANNGVLMAVGAGGTPPYTYAWSSGQTTQTISGLAPGTYTVVVTNPTNGCTATAAATLTNPPLLTLNLSSTNVLCNGANNGTATATPGGGVPPYTYLWSNGASTQMISNLAPGNYLVTVTDANICRIFDDVTITQPAVLTLMVSATDETAFNANNGTATAAANGGTAPLEYLWSNGATTANINNLAPGTYSVTVTDANDCTIEGSATVDAFDCGAFATTISATNVLCNGAATGSATANPIGGNAPFGYLWNTGATTQTISNLIAGNYAVTVTDATNCPTTQSTTITQPAALLLTASSTDETALGANDGTATAMASGGTGVLMYLWSTGATTATITGLAPGIYNVTATDANGCTRTTSVIVNAFACAGFAIVINGDDLSCNGDASGSATASPLGGNAPYEYFWSNGALTQSIANLAAGSYTVTVTDATNCSEIQSITINEPPLLFLNISSTDETALNANDGTATVAAGGGTAPLEYLWSNGSTATNLMNLPPGTYSVTVTDGNDCTATGTTIVNSFSCAGFSATATGTNLLCNGDMSGTAMANPMGGTAPFNYLWSNGGTTQSITNLAVGSYAVTVSDATNCTNIQSINITQPTALVLMTNATDETALNANDGTATAMASGGTLPLEYLWSNGSTATNLMNLPPGTYSVTVTDGNDCTATGTAIVNSFSCAGFSATATGTNLLCNGDMSGAAMANPMGGTAPFNYLWSNGGTTQSITNLAAGSYTVTVSDATNCTNIQSVNITQPTALVLMTTFTNETIVNANDGTAMAMASGGTPPLQYLWSNGATTENLTNLPPGTYEVTVTDANNCSLSDAVSIAAGGMGGGGCTALPVYAISSPETVCQGEPFMLEADDLYPSPSVRYVWILPTGDTLTTAQTFLDLVATSTAFSGEYYVFRDSLGCQSITLGGAPVEVIGLPEGAVFAGADETLCAPQSATLNALPLSTGIGSWQSLGAAKVSSPNQSSTNVSDLQTGANLFVWRVSLDACPQIGADTVSIFVESNPVVRDDNYRILRAQDIIVMEVLLNDDLRGLQDTIMTQVGVPAVGTLEFLEDTHRFRYEAPEDFRGVVSFQYRICPPESACNFECVIATVRIEVFNLPAVPEGLVLNDPGANGQLTIRGVSGFSRVAITIVNRWGDLVFQDEDYNNERPWLGKMQGSEKDLPEGAYYYHLEAYDGEVQIGDTQLGVIHLFEQKF